MLLTPNLSRISEYVQMGTLDYMLTKPVNSQFMVSLRNIGVFNWGDPLLGLGLAGYAFAHLDYIPPIRDLGLFLLLVIASALLLYSFNLLLQQQPSGL
jgi:ABC-2 type transport system permease protein